MSYKRLNFISNLYFYLIFLSGLFYTVLLIFASEKIIPAFIMQIIFLLDTLKFNNNVIGLVTSWLFLLNIISGLLLISLAFRYVGTLIKYVKSVKVTKATINSLQIIGLAKEFLKFESNEVSIFTSGFLRPKIYISSAVFKTHSREELAAMVEHEINHKNNLHPLKIFIANFIKSMLPTIPGQNWLIDNYLTLTEVSSDQFSENKTNNKLPLVSALLKFQNQSLEPGISYFNSQSERIKILVGQKKQFFRIPIAYYSLVLVMIFSSALLIKNSNIFYNCQHLLKCVELLVAPNSQPLVTSVKSQSNAFSTSNHCQ